MTPKPKDKPAGKVKLTRDELWALDDAVIWGFITDAMTPKVLRALLARGMIRCEITAKGRRALKECSK